MITTTHSDKALTIEVSETEAEIRVHFKGRSNDREPGRFLMPVFTEALQRSDGGKRTVVLDLADIEYMNSSTFSPLVKLLDDANRRGIPVRVLYNDKAKWQSLSFSALKAFESSDGKISIRAR